MKYRIDAIESIRPAYAAKLRDAGIETTEDLLIRCSTPAGRYDASRRTGLSELVLLRWAHLADLSRLSGVGLQHGALLGAAGVDTIRELGRQNAESLARRLIEIHERKKMPRTPPPADLVEKWIEVARETEPRIGT